MLDCIPGYDRGIISGGYDLSVIRRSVSSAVSQRSPSHFRSCKYRSRLMRTHSRHEL